MASKTGQLPEMDGPGIEALTIQSIDKAVSKYEKKKDARCQISPGEVAAKQDLLHELQKHRDKLHVTTDGRRFYRCEGVDYFLEESLKRKKADSGEDNED